MRRMTRNDGTVVIQCPDGQVLTVQQQEKYAGWIEAQYERGQKTASQVYAECEAGFISWEQYQAIVGEVEA